MHQQLRFFAGLALFTLLLASPALVLAHGEGPQQTVDDYTITLLLPERGLFTGRNPVAVTLWDWRGNTPEASVSIAPLAFTPPSDGHGDGHDEAAPADDHGDEAQADAHGHDDAAPADDHGDEAQADAHGHDEAAPADDHGDEATETHGHDEAAPADDHGDEAQADAHVEAESTHDHGTTSATEGQGLAVPPVALAAGEELGEYQGELAFDEAGTYSVHVVFTVDGQERGAIFDVAVAQSRPRGLVLGGFALVNGLAIATAAVLKRRTPIKAAKPARPAPAATATPEE
jgi:hypothetical protein